MNPRSLLQLATLAANNADQHPRGLGWLGGIAPLEKYAYAGSVIEWSGEVWLSDGTSSYFPQLGQPAEIAASVDAGLWGGWFSSVEVRTSGLRNTYVTVVVTLATDFARLGDVLSVIEGAVWHTSVGGYQYVAFKTLDLRVVSAPAIAIATPGSTIPSSTPTGQLPSGVTNRNRQQYEDQQCPHPKSIFCDCGEEWSMLKLACVPIDAASDGKNIFDSLASWLGVTPTQAVIVGALGAVLAVVAVKRVL